MGELEKIKAVPEPPLYESEQILVYRAWYGSNDVPCIVKAMRPGLASGYLARSLEAQYRAASTVGKEACPHPLFFGLLGESIALVYKDEGSRVLREMTEGTALPVKEALSIAASLARSVAVMHRAGWLHRSIMPSHVLVDEKGGVQLIGLGNARAIDAHNTDEYTAPDQLEHFGFLAPEHTARVRKPIDWRTDAFSVGATLYALLAGRAPFVGATKSEIIHDCLAGVPPAPGSLRPGISPFIDAIVARAMAKTPDARYRTLPGLIADLEDAAEAEGNEPDREPGTLDYPEAMFKPRPRDTEGVVGVVQLIDRSFPANEPARDALVGAALARTKGETAKLEGFLLEMAESGFARFDAGRGCWSLPRNLSHDTKLTSAIIDMLPARLAGLEEYALRFLECAACSGIEFDAEAVAAIMKSPEPSELTLERAIKAGLVVPSRTSQTVFRFTHPAIRERLYGSLESIRRSSWHSAFADRYERVGRPELAAEHILSDPLRPRRRDEVAKRAEVFIEAADAYAIVDPSKAFSLAAKARAMIGRTGWTDAYEQTVRIVTRYCTYAAASRQEQEFVIAAMELLTEASKEDAPEAEITVIRGYVTLGKSADAVTEGIKALRKLGVRVPAKSGNITFLFWHLLIRIRLAFMREERILNTQYIQDTRAARVIRLLMAFGTSAYITKPTLVSYLVARGLFLSLKYGDHPEAASLYATVGLVESGVLGNFRLGLRFGDLADALADKHALSGRYTQAKVMTAGFISHWSRPIRDTLDKLLDAARIGKATGDAEFSSHAYVTYLQYRLLSGANLQSIWEELPEISGVVQSMHQDLSIESVEAITAFMEFIRGGRYDPSAQVPGHGTWKQWEEGFIPLGIDGFVCDIAVYRSILGYCSGLFAEARDAIEVARPFKQSHAGQFPSAILALVDALVSSGELIAAARPGAQAVSRKFRRRAHRRMAETARLMATLKQINPAMYEGKAALTKAMVLFHRGKSLASFDAFEQAIRHAHNAGQLLDEAATASAYTLCLRDSGREPLALFHLRASYDALSRWGAPQLAEALADRHPELGTWVRSFPGSVPGGSLRFVDTEILISASKELAGEADRTKLLERLVRLSMVTTGARYGAVWEHSEDSWSMTASSSYPATGNEQPIAPIKQLENARDRQIPVIIDDEGRAGCSAFLPLLSGGRTIGVLFLRNDLVNGAFSEDRMSIVETLAVQAAVAVENAELYKGLERKVLERTHELEEALKNVRRLRGLIPICSSCKKVRDDSGYWSQVEEYISARTEADFTHGLCPDCLRRYSEQPGMERADDA